VENEVQDIPETQAEVETRPVEKSDSNIAIMITLAALLLWFGFQLVQQLRERSNLSAVKTSQESALQESEKIRAQFQTLVSKTSELANQGHPGARMVIDELEKRGIGAAPPPMPAARPESKPGK